MWNKLSLRLKITLLTFLSLTLFAIGITIVSVLYAGQQQLFLLPAIQEPVEIIVLPDDIRNDLHSIIAAGQSMRQADIRTNSILLSILFVGFGTLSAWIITGAALKPIKKLADTTQQINEHNLSVFLEIPKAQDEVSRLTQSFNDMMRKINVSFERQKRFSQNTAHELKTPLSFMRASIDILKLDEKPTIQDYEEVIEIVEESTERLIQMVERLLQLNHQIDASDFQVFEGKPCFQRILQQLSPEITNKNLIVELVGNNVLNGDPILLERAFFNLVHNAIRYNVAKGKIKISLQPEFIMIEDTGIGMKETDLNRVFDPFYCVDKSRSKKQGGHGLGMAIAKDIFDKHGLEIKIHSKLGIGTKISINLDNGN